jgi:hypothetical protein
MLDCYSGDMLATLLLPAGVTSEASIMYKDEYRLLNNADDVDETLCDAVLPQKMSCNNIAAIRRFSILN